MRKAFGYGSDVPLRFGPPLLHLLRRMAPYRRLPIDLPRLDRVGLSFTELPIGLQSGQSVSVQLTSKAVS